MKGIERSEAISSLAGDLKETYALVARANRIRLENRGKKVGLCGILNAKSGLCSEDCRFCVQSARSEAPIERYPLVSSAKMIEAARIAEAKGATRFGIVTSGMSIDDPAEIAEIAAAVKTISSELRITPCASLGNVGTDSLKRLADAGLNRYHHNLESAESFFPKICTTHKWSEAVDTVLAAKDIGMSVCSGGLFGLGESIEQRVELLEAIRTLDVDAVPINFFNPLPGTRLPDAPLLRPLECIKLIAVARLMMPDKEIRVCGGREVNLRSVQPLALAAGADGIMVGGYLTSQGRDVGDDIAMIEEAGFEVERR